MKKVVRFTVCPADDPSGFHHDVGLLLDVDVTLDRDDGKWLATTVYEDGRKYGVRHSNQVSAILRLINKIVK